MAQQRGDDVELAWAMRWELSAASARNGHPVVFKTTRMREELAGLGSIAGHSAACRCRIGSEVLGVIVQFR